MRVFARTHLRLPALFVLVFSLLLVSLPAKADSNPNPGILPPNQPAYGKSYGEWAAAWWNWALSGPDGNNVLQDTTGALCGLNQSGPVWFLAGTLNSGAAVRTCTIPAGKAVFFPVANSFLSAEARNYGQTRKAVKVGWQKSFDWATATIDGQDVADLVDFNVISPNFDLVLPANNIFGVDAGSYSPSAAIGIHLMLAPLSPGLHEIHVQAAFKNADTGVDDIIDVTYHLTVSS
jgi:hypothetical protein